MSNDRIKELEELIIENKRLYYSLSEETKISDEEYDSLEDELKSLDPENPVLSIVGSEYFSFEKVPHQKPMLSLEKTYKESDLYKLLEENEKLIGTFKIDGSSCSLIYKNGKLIDAKTRGDGLFGERILDKVLHIESIPKKIKTLDEVEVRGEIYCKKDNFNSLSSEMIRRNLNEPSSIRNIVAGLLGRKDHKDLSSYLDFYAFQIINEKQYLDEEEKNADIVNLGFSLPPSFSLNKKKDIDDCISNMKDFLNSGDYLIDGLVFTINDIKKQLELGYTGHHPKYRLAFKVQGEKKETKILDIEWQISKFGVYTPVALLDPVELSGAMISKVTLHNYKNVVDFNLKKGDIISIVRSGEVIPKFIDVVKSSTEEFSILEDCLFCSTKLKNNGIRLFCSNEKCEGKKSKYLLNFVKKIGIDDLNEKRLDQMISQGLVSEIPDLYNLKEDDLITLDKVKSKLASKILENINKTKDVSIYKFVDALGFEGGAKNKTKLVIEKGFDSLDKILSLSLEDLIPIKGFQEKSAKDYLSSISDKKELIKTLISIGFNPSFPVKKGDSLSDLTFCITGKTSIKRKDLENIIKDNGGKASSSLSSNTDYLICNEESSSSKFKKAESLGVKVLKEDDFKEKFKISY
tara:strand:+ start:15802 stop:17700 length:1899 start_codon:yes stop_codon:yes gene_type:complete